jgi:squalene synthase HpnC
VIGTVPEASDRAATFPDGAMIRAKAVGENFPVALRVLPRVAREELTAIYGFARLVDDLGDELDGGPGARLAALQLAADELDRAFSGTAEHPVFAALTPVIRAHGLPRRPFADLIEANRCDQTKTRYETYDELLGYCSLSANPVGRLVLGLAGRSDDETACGLSDRVCTGLQIVEHLQDVGEDAARGRIYLPAEDLRAFAVTEDDLIAGTGTAPAVRRLVAFETARARDLLSVTAELAARLPGVWRLAVAGFGGGGLAQVDALEHSGYDVLGEARPVSATRGARVAGVLRVLVRASRRR